MNTALAFLVLISLICIPVFILLAIVKLIRKQSSKKHFILSGVSAFVFLASFIGFGFTMDEPVTKDSDAYNESSYAAMSVETSAPEPTATPTPEPTVAPTPEPTASPTPKPTTAPTPEPTVAPTPEPTAAPTPEPTASPTPKPTTAPTPEPTVAPTPEPTTAPTPEPTVAPTPEPTAAPTPEPTIAPTPEPTTAPTSEPTVTPTPEPAASSEGSILVWVDDTAKRYHRKNGCGMDNAYQVTLEEAIAMGKTPCGRCYK